MPEITIARGLPQAIGRYIKDFLQENGMDNEAGGMLVGRYRYDFDSTLVGVDILGFIPAGPKATFDPGKITFDGDSQAAHLRAIQIRDSSLQCGGSIHRHPGDHDRPSSGDLDTDTEALRSSGSAMLVAGIITIENPKPDPLSFRVNDLKLDFFILKAGESNYIKVQPTISDEPVIDVPSSGLVEYAQRRGPDLTYDIRTLKTLTGIGTITLREAPNGGGAVLVTVDDPAMDAEVHYVAYLDDRIECILRKDGSTRVLEGPWQAPQGGRHIWFSHIHLVVRSKVVEERNGNVLAGIYRGPAWFDQNPRRLALERRAMFELLGDRAILKHRGGTLFWTLTLRESGRSLDVEIIYPEDYPTHPPLIRSVKPLPVSPHSPGNTHYFCWHPHSDRGDWSPNHDTAATAASSAMRWFGCLLVFLTKGQWPVAADHPR